MNVKERDPLRRIAEQVADCFAYSGYAFIEDNHIEGLANLLGSFLTVAGIPSNTADADAPIRDGSRFSRGGSTAPPSALRPAAQTVLP